MITYQLGDDGNLIVKREDGALLRLFGVTRYWLPNIPDHRREYTVDDARAVVAWLNEREAGYPSGPPLLLRLP